MTELHVNGVLRRDFLKVATLAAGAVGLPAWAGEKMAEKAASSAKPPVIWLHFQECTGCSESLLRTSAPDVAELILGLISLDYHETLMVPSGYQAEKSLEQSMERNAGKYVLVVEGAIPTKEDGIYCRVGGKTALEQLKTVSRKAAAVVSIGSCASWGGIPSADPNPTGAVGVDKIITDRPVVNLPGCPATTSSRCRAPGPSASARPASGARSRSSASACRSTTRSTSSARPRPAPTRPSTRTTAS